MHFEKLPRLPQRPEKEPEVEIEIWQPEWKCFCCHDSGLIVPHLVRLVIDDYDENRDKFPLCQKPGCCSGDRYSSELLLPSLDTRISARSCKKLDEFERDTWRKTMFVHVDKIRQDAQDLAREKSLRMRDRTHLEQQYAKEHHRQAVRR